jgi:hypothetical protein
MSKSHCPRDHQSFELKLLLRRRLLAGLRPEGLCDLCAGQGRLLRALAADFAFCHAVEKNARQAAILEARLREEGLDHVTVHRMDHEKFVRDLLPGLDAVNFLDVDAYQNPHPLLRLVFSNWRPAGPAAIAVTDGGRLGIVRGQRLRLDQYRGRLPPGAAPGPPARAHPLLVAEHELIVRAFWRELAAKRRLVVRDFIAAWPPGRRVLYYGLIVEPD